MQAYDMRINLFEKMLGAANGIHCRAKIKVALKQLRDWFNQSLHTPCDYAAIEDRIREQRLKYETYRFPPTS